MIFGATRHSYTLEVSSKESSVEDSSTLFWNHHICIEEIVVTLSLSTDFAFIGVAKGQLISKAIYSVLDSPKNERKRFDLLYYSTMI